MKTQLFKARDMKTAMNLVNDEYGDKAIILSTKRNNGVVEVEASDNDKVIETHKKKVEEKKNFSKVFNKEINICRSTSKYCGKSIYLRLFIYFNNLAHKTQKLF